MRASCVDPGGGLDAFPSFQASLSVHRELRVLGSQTKKVIMKKTMWTAMCLCASLLAGCSQQEQWESLVPGTPSEAPDYFCTWNIQGYVVDYSGSDPTRRAMNEENIFGKGKYQDWVSFYPRIREDLYFVMDDSWDIPKDSNETWNKSRRPGSLLRESAPARVSRRMPLPQVDDTTALRPFVLASRYPCGAVAVAAIGRGTGREYVSKEVPVTVEAGDWNAPVGLFGCFSRVTLTYTTPIPDGARVLAQDLAGDTPVDITGEVDMEGGRMVVPGNVIRRVGLMAATEGDLSDPGLVLKVVR